MESARYPAVPFEIEKIRADFPYLETCLYLNTAATGVAWKGAGAAAAAFYDRMAARGYDGRDDWRAVAGRVQAQIGRLANVAPESISFCGSTTEALNLIAWSADVRDGDNVVFAEDEFPSVCGAAGILCARGGRPAKVQVADEMGRTDLLVRAAANARFVLVSHVHWQTGTKVDLARLAQACRTSGALLIVDGIQALGATKVDASFADAYAASVFKWLLSGFGLGIVILNPSLRERLTPAFRGYANPPPSHDLRYGHINYPGLCVLEATLAYLESLGWEAVTARTEVLAARLIERLSVAGIEIATPPGQAAGIVSIAARDSAFTAQRLHERGISVEPRGRFLRASPHFYNTEAEIDRFCEVFLELEKGSAA